MPDRTMASMAKEVLVVDLGRPKFLLLPFFLREDGFLVREARSMEDGEALLQDATGDAPVPPVAS